MVLKSVRGRSDAETEEDSDETTSVSSTEDEKTSKKGVNKSSSSEETSTDSSFPSFSIASSESEIDLRKVKQTGGSRKFIKKITEIPEIGKKKISTLPSQQLVTNSLKKDLQRTRVIRKNVEAKPLNTESTREKKKVLSTMTADKSKLAKKPPVNKPDITKRKKENIEVHQKATGDSTPNSKEATVTVKKKTGTIQKKKPPESSPLGKASTKEESIANDNSKENPAQKTSTKVTQKKKVPEPLPTRRLAVKKNEAPGRQVRPQAATKTDGRSEPAGRVPRKPEPTTRTVQRKPELEPRGPQGRTAFTMTGLRQVAQNKNLAKERLVGQSDQA